MGALLGRQVAVRELVVGRPVEFRQLQLKPHLGDVGLEELGDDGLDLILRFQHVLEAVPLHKAPGEDQLLGLG